MSITFGQRYLAISLIIAQSAFLCSWVALVDSLSKSFFATPSLDWAALPSVSEGTAAEPGFVAIGSLPSVDWFCNRPYEVNMRSCVAFGLVHGARPAKLGWAYRAGRQHGERAALSSMAACDIWFPGRCGSCNWDQGIIVRCEGNGVRSSSWGIPPWEPPASEKSVGVRVGTLGDIQQEVRIEKEEGSLYSRELINRNVVMSQ